MAEEAQIRQDKSHRNGAGFRRPHVHLQTRPRQMTKNDELLSRLREIAANGAGDLGTRVRAAEAAIQSERARFPASDAGRIQWNWYIGQLSNDIRFERDRLAMAARKKAKPGEPSPGPMLELFDSTQPRILGLKESTDRSNSLAAEFETSPALAKSTDSSSRDFR